MKTSISLFLTIITFTAVAVAQKKTEKVEVGVQVTALTFFDPDFPAHETKPGLGGRVTYNFNDSIAAEAKINFFRQVSGSFFTESNAVQAQFGVKLGKRFEKFGLSRKYGRGYSVSTRSFPFNRTAWLLSDIIASLLMPGLLWNSIRPNGRC
jgi:Outer membrane protein beta-barrel domain